MIPCRAAAVALTSLTALLLAGCTADTAPPTPPAKTVAVPVPPISEPRDVSTLITQPCAALPAQHAVALGFPAPPRTEDSQVLGSKQCVWTTSASGTDPAPVYILRVIAVDQPYLRPLQGPGVPPVTMISGFPAAVRPSQLLAFCDIEVKVADHRTVNVTYGTADGKATPQQSCEQGTRLTAVIIDLLPGAGGVH